jgi:hypothetical protein
MNNITGNNWDSSNASRGPSIIFSSYNAGYTYINTSPEILCNYSISSNFLNF